MKTHVLRVEPYSEAEDRLIELAKAVNGMRLLTCKLGCLFNVNYNEYTFSDELFVKIREYLLKRDEEA